MKEFVEVKVCFKLFDQSIFMSGENVGTDPWADDIYDDWEKN